MSVATSQVPLLTAEQVSKQLGTHRHALPSLISHGLLPPPDEINPKRWRTDNVPASLPTPETVIGDLNRTRAGDWRMVGWSRGLRRSQAKKWDIDGLLKPDDKAKKLVIVDGRLEMRDFVRDPSIPDQDELTGPEAAKRYGYSPAGWYALVRKGRAPRPVKTHPWRWTIPQLVEWEKIVPSIEEAKAMLQRSAEERGKMGEWALLTEVARVNASDNGDISVGTFYEWKDKLTKGDDFDEMVVRGTKDRSTRIGGRIFVRKFAINALEQSEHARRSKSRNAYLSTKDKFPQEKDTLFTPRAATAYLGIDRRQLERWSDFYDDGEGEGCPHLDGRKLTTDFCDGNGRIVSTKDEGVRCWYLSELAEAKKKRNAVDRYVKGKDGIWRVPQAFEDKHQVYGIGEVTKLTGIPRSTLERKSATEALGLVRVRIPIMRRCRRKLKKSGLMKTYPVFFMRDSVNAYAAAHPNLQEKNGAPDTMTTGEAAKELGINAVLAYRWCRDGLLDHNGVEEYWTPRGLRKGYRPTKASVAAAKKILDSVGGDVFKASRLLRADRDRLATSAAASEGKNSSSSGQESAAGKSNGQKKDKARNKRGPKVKTYEKLRICHELYGRVKRGEIGLKNALTEARRSVSSKPPTRNGHIIEYAKRYEKTEEFKRSHNSKSLFT